MRDLFNKEQYVIEFRNGSFFQNLEADRGGLLASAQKFNSKEEAEKFMDIHPWIYINGGMAFEIKSA